MSELCYHSISWDTLAFYFMQGTAARHCSGAIVRSSDNSSLTLTLGSMSHEIMSSTLNIIWPMHQQSLKLLHPAVKEKIYLQENTLFDLDLWVTQNVAQCPLHHVTYAPTDFEVTTSKGLGRDAFTRKFNIWPWGQGHTKCCPVPSTSCDLFSYKVWSCNL